MYGLVKDPTPDKGRALKKKADDWIAAWKEDLRSKGLPVPGEDKTSDEA